MSLALNNISTPDAYGAEATVEVDYPCRLALIQVYNAAVYRQLLVGLDDNPKSASWQSELFLAPGLLQRAQRLHLFGVRVRNAVAGVPAQVTIELIGRNE